MKIKVVEKQAVDVATNFLITTNMTRFLLSL